MYVEKYNEAGTKNERSVIIGLEEGIWKLRVIRGEGGFRREGAPYVSGK
jgi:hypothetical protein